MESAMKSLCFFRPRAITITSPVGGSEGGTGTVEGAGEDGAGDEGREGGGGGQGQGEARGEGGDVIAQGQRSVKSRLLCGMESCDSHLALDSRFNAGIRTGEIKKKNEREKDIILDFKFLSHPSLFLCPKKRKIMSNRAKMREL